MSSNPVHASSDANELSASALFRAMAARATDVLVPRWIFLRALGLIFFSAFYSLAFQVHGLIGERGILPAGLYLQQLRQALPGIARLWYAPSVFWLSSGDVALSAAVAIGIVCSLLLAANVWPRAMTAVCTLLFLSFIVDAAGFFVVPVRRNAARGGVHFDLVCATRFPAGAGRRWIRRRV